MGLLWYFVVRCCIAPTIFKVNRITYLHAFHHAVFSVRTKVSDINLKYPQEERNVSVAKTCNSWNLMDTSELFYQRYCRRECTNSQGNGFHPILSTCPIYLGSNRMLPCGKWISIDLMVLWPSCYCQLCPWENKIDKDILSAHQTKSRN